MANRGSHPGGEEGGTDDVPPAADDEASQTTEVQATDDSSQATEAQAIDDSSQTTEAQAIDDEDTDESADESARANHEEGSDSIRISGPTSIRGLRASVPPLSIPPRRSSLPPSQRLAAALAGVRNPLWSLAALVVVVYGIESARAVLVPVVGAALLAIIVSPGVRWLEERRVPRVLAVLAVVVAMVLGLMAIGAMVLGSLAGFRESSLEYGVRLQKMVLGITSWLHGHGVKVDLGAALRSIEPGPAAEKAATVVMDSVGGLLSAVSNMFFVAITMVLILMESQTVPAKLKALADEPEEDISYFRHIAAQVQSYLAIKTVLSLATGVCVGVWAAILDVDFAMLWGILAFLLNYIPNVGSILAAVPAMLLALIQHGPANALALGGGYVVVNMVIGNVIEPMWMGRKMGLSTTVVFVSLFVWYEIWGPIGMLFSVPLTMVLKIMLEHSRDYAFVATWLDSGEPPPSPSEEGAEPIGPSTVEP